MNTVGARPFRLDDAVGVSAPTTDPKASPQWESLSGTDRLDERIARGMAERARFEARPSRRAAAETKS